MPDLLDLPSKIIVYYLLLDLLDKQYFGMLNLAMMVFSYHSLSQLGVVDWLMYELPKKYVLKQKMDPLLNESFFFSFINQLFLTGVILLILSFYGESLFFSIALVAYLFHTYFYNAYLHKTLFLRFQYKFERLLRLRILLTLTRVTLEVLSIIYVGIYGFLAVQAFIFIVPIVLLKSDIRLSFRLKMKPSRYLELVRFGLPFFLVTLVATIISNMDRWFIASIYGLEWFATYSVGVFMVSAILIAPGKVHSICTQYLKEMFVGDISLNLNVKRTFAINNFLIFILIIGLSAGLFFENIILLYIPQYADLVQFINVLMLSIILRFSSALTANTLYLLDEKGAVVKIQIIMAGLYCLLLAAIYSFDLGMLFVIWGMSFVFLAQTISCVIVMISIPDVIMNSEIAKFLMLILVSSIFYYLYDFTEMELPWILYMGLCCSIFFWKINETKNYLNYISSRGFSRK